ncbi:MAG TPA: hypothetical protein VHN37_14340 [Actinomycetota bacterium]|nr:hypothetical protein [Actinomycetota bacterium]
MRSTAHEFLALTDELLPEQRVDAPERDAAVYRFSAIVGRDKKLAGGKTAHGVSALYLGGLRVFRGRGRQEMAGRMISGMRDLLVAPENEYLRIRATGVSSEGAAILVVAPQPEPRLPALAALLAQKGFGFLGDELVKVEPVLNTAFPTPLPILVDELDAGRFPEARLDPPRPRSSRVEGMTPRRPLALATVGGAFGAPAPVRWVVFPEFGASKTELEPAEGSELVFAGAGATLNMHVWRERALVFLRRLLEEASVSRLRIATIETAADAIASAAPMVLGR